MTTLSREAVPGTVPRVLVTQRLLAPVQAELGRRLALDVHDSDRPLPRRELLRRARGCAGLVTTPTDRVDEELLDAAGPGLRVIAQHAVGYDNVDVAACTRRGILVAHTPGVLTQATAELTMALLLALLRRVVEGDRLIRRRRRWVWSPTWMLGTGLQGKTLGIVGYGRIGQAVAELARAFGMDVVYTSRSGGIPLADLLGLADAVSLHVPLTPETRHLIDGHALSLMRPTAVLVNTSRGPVVDEQALVEALREGRIAGAALDVYEREPKVSEELLQLDNVVLTPHLGSATRETREAMGMLCVEALRAVLLDGQPPPHLVNPEALSARMSPRSQAPG